MKKIVGCILCMMFLVFIAPAAQALTIEFDQSNFWLGDVPYATLNIEASSGSATFTLTRGEELLAADGEFMSFGFNSTITDLVLADFGGLPANWGLTFDQQMDGFGNFMYEIGSSAEADRVESLTFTITDGAISSDSDFYIANLNGNHFASHVGPNSLTQTGFISDGTPSVPEPATMFLLGTGFIVLAGFSRRKFKK